MVKGPLESKHLPIPAYLKKIQVPTPAAILSPTHPPPPPDPGGWQAELQRFLTTWADRRTAPSLAFGTAVVAAMGRAQAVSEAREVRDAEHQNDGLPRIIYPDTPWDCHICRSIGVVWGVN